MQTAIKTEVKPLSPEQQAHLEQILAIAHHEDVCKNLLDLKVENATLAQIIERIKAAFPNQDIAIEVRQTEPVRLSFNVEATRVGDLLQSVAALSNCKFWVLPGGLLISPREELTEAEHDLVRYEQSGLWAKDKAAIVELWSNDAISRTLFEQIIAQEVLASGLQPEADGSIKLAFGDFSGSSQQILRRMVAEISSAGNQKSDFVPNKAQPAFHLSPDSPITVNASKYPDKFVISFDGNPSDTAAPILRSASTGLDSGIPMPKALPAPPKP